MEHRTEPEMTRQREGRRESYRWREDRDGERERNEERDMRDRR